MEGRQYIWVNGDFLRADQPAITLANRAFAYGDGFFESIHAYGTEGKFLHLHFSRILHSIKLLGFERPGYLTQDFLAKEITRLLNKNRIFGSARVRITLVRNSGGLYTPTSNAISIFMQAQELSHSYYPLNSRGLVIDIYSEIRKPINILSSIKSCNAQLYVMAGLYKQQLGVDDCLLINDQNRIVEAISSNVFLVLNGDIYTPSLDEGCVAGVMRQVVIDLATRQGIKVQSNASLEPEMLLDAEEMFLTNAISGITWVVGLKQKRYFGTIAKRLSEALNAEVSS